MKKLILLAALALLTALPAAAQLSYTTAYITKSWGCTNRLINNTTVTANLGSALDVRRYNQIAIQPYFVLGGDGSNAACIFNYVGSVDGTNYGTTALWTISQIANGTTAVVTNYAITLGPYGWIKPLNVIAGQNGTTGFMTNIVVMYSLKGNRDDQP